MKTIDAALAIFLLGVLALGLALDRDNSRMRKVIVVTVPKTGC